MLTLDGHPNCRADRERKEGVPDAKSAGLVERLASAEHTFGRHGEVQEVTTYGEPRIPQQATDGFASEERHSEFVVLDLCVNDAGGAFATAECGI
jgi:hypothetical protein